VVHGVLAAVNTTVASVGTVLRVRNGDLWDAIGTAIIRQVIRAGQARQMYARFCQARGEPVSTPHGTRYLFPTAQTITDLPAQAFTTLGMAFKHRPLLAAADAVLTHGSTWAQLDPPALAEALQAVPRIGPWTAGAAVADYTGDFACYPYADLAVRTWTRRAAPDIDWPQNEPEFAALWHRGTGDHLSALTLLTLAWGGTHVRSP
jgi:DNA-3-methyladenine glycosylase II